ncbi:hydrolase [Deinococcus sp. SL84]|uniref:hydrolase n=1 Tax=Deinococcus sp. SL84 TaxID=2994663 RepID=UPI00227339B0|nr:hydrolase [Deinococcus sp. SL84]MCY1703997.1 hydrolase [Deinococcus sp. SL84]
MGPGTDAPVLDFAPWTQTASGIRLDLLSPQPDMFTREDIAAGLSHAARFSGQTGRFFSVAQHSLLVSSLLKAWGHTPEVQLLGLLHDAQEAYLCDLARPVKVLVPGYKELELRLWAAIRERFGLDDLPPEVKDADNAALHAEAWELLGPPAGDWAGPQAEASLQTVPDARHWLNAVLTPQEARSAFLQRWAELEGPSATGGNLN